MSCSYILFRHIATCIQRDISSRSGRLIDLVQTTTGTLESLPHPHPRCVFSARPASCSLSKHVGATSLAFLSDMYRFAPSNRTPSPAPISLKTPGPLQNILAEPSVCVQNKSEDKNSDKLVDKVGGRGGGAPERNAGPEETHCSVHRGAVDARRGVLC